MVEMTRERLNRRTYKSVYDRFREWVANRRRIGSPSIGSEVERAMLEFMDEDELVPIETALEPLLEAAGLSRGDGARKNRGGREPADGPKTPVGAHVDPEVEEAFEAYATEHGMAFPDALAAALRDRMAGGREGYLVDRLEEVVPAAAEAFAALDGEASKHGPVRRDAIAISRSLPDTFTEDQLHEAIDEATSGTDYMHETRAPAVIDHTGVVRWTRDGRADLFMPPEERNELARRKAEAAEEESAGSPETEGVDEEFGRIMEATPEAYATDGGREADR